MHVQMQPEQSAATCCSGSAALQICHTCKAVCCMHCNSCPCFAGHCSNVNLLSIPVVTAGRPDHRAHPLVNPESDQSCFCRTHPLQKSGVKCGHFWLLLQTLTPRQEAFLDVQSYPFCPDIWQMTSLLATKKRQPEMTVPNLDIAGASLADVLPHASAFQVLVSPIAAQGIGLRLKRTCPPPS